MKFNSKDLLIPKKKFRPELEGLRAVASILVAIYHIWLGSVSGGVDVFFVVSGYLITQSLLSKMELHGSMRFIEYVIGLVRRLFPIAFIVLLFSTIVSFFIMPQTMWRQIISEIFASAFYIQNWQLATNAVDYLAQNNEASPLQHFWALSIQGQFYIVWPLIIFIAFLLAKKVFNTPHRKTLLGVLCTLFVLSLSYSIYITTVNQPWAYFDTFARVWEFSIGGIVALLIPYMKPNQFVSTLIGWLGLSMIVFTGIVLPVSTVFPGYAALLPITGALFVMISAERVNKYGVKKLLGSNIFMYFGSISYGFYLWHWPLLIFYYVYFKVETVSMQGGVAILLVAFILSVITTKMIETPIRTLSVAKSKRKIGYALLPLVLLVLMMNLSWSMYADREEEAFQQSIESDENIELMDEPLYDPSLPSYYADDCFVDINESGLKVCSYGKTNNPDYVVALVGGSRTGHWLPALEEIAEELQMQIDVYNKNGCRFSTDDFDGMLSDSCMEWNELVFERLLEDPPDVIFTTANAGNNPITPTGYIEMFEKFAGITKVFAIRDNPSMATDIPNCVEIHGAEHCAERTESLLKTGFPGKHEDASLDHVHFVDLTNYVCDDDVCHAVIDDIVVYRDRYHYTNTFIKTLAEPLKEELVKVLES